MADKKLYYDGDRVSFDIPLGDITYTNAKGAKEIYKAERIELHFPAEHYVTFNKQTPRYALELQIVHSLQSTNNMKITTEKIKVNKAIVSILFTLGELDEGDIFLNQLGISKYNTNDDGKFHITKKNGFIDRNRKIPASHAVGFNYLAFQGLLNLINANPHLYFYYGSETAPPCRENVLWMVFAQPRSLSKPQFDYLLLTIGKHKDGKNLTDARTPNQLYGNKRNIVLYDDIERGKILSNPLGIKHIKRMSFFRKMKDDKHK